MCNKNVTIFTIRRYDFVLFDYSPEEYLAFGKDEITTLTCKKWTWHFYVWKHEKWRHTTHNEIV